MLEYQAPSGFSVQIEAEYIDGLPHAVCSWKGRLVHFDNDRRIRDALKDAFTQRPPKSQPFVIIIVDNLVFPLWQYHIENALFGTLGTTWSVGNPSSSYRDSNGFIKPWQNTELSAVGFCRLLLSQPSSRENKLSIYHNPWSIYPLKRDVLTGRQVRHFIQNDGRPEFIQV